MKFELGDDTDVRLRTALQHEFMRCDDAFDEFIRHATQLIKSDSDRRLAYRAYNAYSRFVHHLYEFYIGAIKRKRRDTAAIRAEESEAALTRELQRILNNRRQAIIEGRAPKWENGIEAYPETVPTGVATEFRRLRNLIAGHATHERTGINLSEFFQRNHMYLLMMFQEPKWLWLPPKGDVPDLGEITAFSILLATSPSAIVEPTIRDGLIE